MNTTPTPSPQPTVEELHQAWQSAMAAARQTAARRDHAVAQHDQATDEACQAFERWHAANYTRSQRTAHVVETDKNAETILAGHPYAWHGHCWTCNAESAKFDSSSPAARWVRVHVCGVTQ